MKIAIVEDNPAVRKVLMEYLQRVPISLEVVFEADSVESAVQGFSQHQVDLAILDVEIKNGLIFEALEQLPKLDFELIFCSAHGSYAVNAFRFSAMNFIVKPLVYEELLEQLEVVNEKLSKRSELVSLKQQLRFLQQVLSEPRTEKIALPGSEGVSFYRFDQISWVEADSNYCNFYMVNGERVLVSKPLKEFADLLEDRGFYRVHKSSIVNLRYVRQYIRGEGGSVILEDGSEVSVSRRKKEGLLKALS